MFERQLYMTQGIQEKLPEEIINELVHLTKTLPGKGVRQDSFQVFQLNTNQEGDLLITHSQEVPQYRGFISLKTTESICEKVFFIDGGEYATMMLAEEY